MSWLLSLCREGVSLKQTEVVVTISPKVPSIGKDDVVLPSRQHKRAFAPTTHHPIQGVDYTKMKMIFAASIYSLCLSICLAD